MSFKCQHCHQPQPKGVAPNKVVTFVRDKVYPFRERANRSSQGYRTDDPGGKGQETVTEEVLCTKCAEEVESEGVIYVV